MHGARRLGACGIFQVAGALGSTAPEGARVQLLLSGVSGGQRPGKFEGPEGSASRVLVYIYSLTKLGETRARRR